MSTTHVQYKETFKLIDTLTIPSENVPIGIATQDTRIHSIVSVGNYLYALLYPLGEVYKIDISTFTIVDILHLSIADFYAMRITTDGTYLYVGGAPVYVANIVRIDIATFTEVNHIALTPAFPVAITDLIIVGTNLYASVVTAPAGSNCRVVKVNLVTFTETATLAVTVDYPRWYYEDYCLQATETHLYVIGRTAGVTTVSKIDLATFVEVDTLTINTIHDDSRVLQIINNLLYIGDVLTVVAVVNLDTFTVIRHINISGGVSCSEYDNETGFFYTLSFRTVGAPLHTTYQVSKYLSSDMMKIDELEISGSPKATTINSDYLFTATMSGYIDGIRYVILSKVIIRETVIIEINSTTTTTAVVSDTRVRTIRHVSTLSPTIIG